VGDNTADVVIPAGQVGSAMGDLMTHIRMIHDASTFLYCGGSHAPAAYFAILCMEEMSKYLVLASRHGRGKGVSVGDMGGMRSHEGKTLSLLLQMRALLRPNTTDARREPRSSPNCSLLAAKLESAKQLVVHHGNVNGSMSTLEGILGMEDLSKLSTRLQRAVCQGLLAMGAATQDGQAVARERRRGQADAGVDSLLVAVLGLTDGVPLGSKLRDGGIPSGAGLDRAIASLEWHVAALDKHAVDLHNGGHYEASIFMSIMSFEEANRHYVLAKCKRHGIGAAGAQARGIWSHNSKLSVFLKDVDSYLGDRNAKGEDRRRGKYNIIHPGALLKLDGLKHLALYFDHVCGRTMTLRGILGRGTGTVSQYLRDILEGMSSWAIICDGDSEDPYRRHNKNPVHYQRYQKLVNFKTSKENEVYDQGTYWIIGKLDYLNDAVKKRDARQCEAMLAQIQRRL